MVEIMYFYLWFLHMLEGTQGKKFLPFIRCVHGTPLAEYPGSAVFLAKKSSPFQLARCGICSAAAVLLRGVGHVGRSTAGLAPVETWSPVPGCDCPLDPSSCTPAAQKARASPRRWGGGRSGDFSVTLLFLVLTKKHRAEFFTGQGTSSPVACEPESHSVVKKLL